MNEPTTKYPKFVLPDADAEYVPSSRVDHRRVDRIERIMLEMLRPYDLRLGWEFPDWKLDSAFEMAKRLVDYVDEHTK